VLAELSDSTDGAVVPPLNLTLEQLGLNSEFSFTIVSWSNGSFPLGRVRAFCGLFVSSLCVQSSSSITICVFLALLLKSPRVFDLLGLRSVYYPFVHRATVVDDPSARWSSVDAAERCSTRQSI
jgi:hypothetical protein